MARFTGNEIRPEDVDAAIEMVARLIVKKYGLQEVGLMFLETTNEVMSGLYNIYGELAISFLFPFQSILGTFGESYEQTPAKYITIFKDKKNVDRLIKRIKEIAEEEKKEKELEAQRKKKPKTRNLFRRLKRGANES